MRALTRMMPPLALIAALAGACDRGPSCEEAADRMVEVANADAPAGEVTDPEARERLRTACERDDWPAEIRRCLVEAPAQKDAQEAATACMRALAGGS